MEGERGREDSPPGPRQLRPLLASYYRPRVVRIPGMRSAEDDYDFDVDKDRVVSLALLSL